MSEKSYVTMGKCAVCGEPDGTLGMDRRIRDYFEEMYTVLTLEPCEVCKEKYLKNGTLIYGKTSEEAQGVESLVIVTDEGFRKIFSQEPPENKIIFAKSEIVRNLIDQQKKINEEK